MTMMLIYYDIAALRECGNTYHIDLHVCYGGYAIVLSAAVGITVSHTYCTLTSWTCLWVQIVAVRLSCVLLSSGGSNTRNKCAL